MDFKFDKQFGTLKSQKWANKMGRREYNSSDYEDRIQ